MTEFLKNQDYNLYFSSNPYINDCVINFKLNIAKKTISLTMKETKKFDVLKWIELLPVVFDGCEKGYVRNEDQDYDKHVDYLGLSTACEETQKIPEPQDFELPDIEVEKQSISENISIFFNEKLEENSKTNNVLISIDGLVLIDHSISFDKFLSFVPGNYGIDADLSQDSEHNIELGYKHLKILDKNIKI